MVERFQNYIGGKFVDAGDGRTFDSLDPYAGQAWAAIPEGSTEDIDHAVAAARSALQGEWGKMTGFQRARLMRRLADLITENAERLARVEVRDNGKLYREMIGQLQGLGAWYEYFAGHADKIEGRVIPTDKPNYFCFTRREPVGVVGAITPWNSPLLLMTFKLAPGLAAGCTFVVKPSEHSPASTLAFARAPAGSSVPRSPGTRAWTRSRSPARPRPAGRWRTPRPTTSTG
jgi:acyl-CoA reductase-like NAD-dependent aldehyde dehydrogenase